MGQECRGAPTRVCALCPWSAAQAAVSCAAIPGATAWHRYPRTPMPVTHPLHAPPRPIRYLSLASSLALSLALALAALLAACGHSPPQTALPPPGPGRPVATEPAPGPAGCRQTPAARAALRGVALELQARGLALQVRCQEGNGGSGGDRGNGGDGSSVVQLRVLDGIQARAVLRGPLADGQAVDMGPPCGVGSPGAAVRAGGFSPDVQYNREWLRALMARHQFDNLPDAWWHFAYRADPPAPAR